MLQQPILGLPHVKLRQIIALLKLI